jgi:hypothetical protein
MWAHPATPTGLCGGSVTSAIKNMPCMFFIADATAPRPSNPLRTNRQALARTDRHALRVPFGLELCKTGFRGASCYLESKQHAQRFACFLGRQSLAHEPLGACANGSPCAMRSLRLGTLQDRVLGHVVLLGKQTTRSTFRGSDWAQFERADLRLIVVH